MQYFTEINIPEYPDKIDHSSKIIMMGSCFAENIGAKLQNYKFDIDINPFGILYNPISIANSLKILLERRLFNSDDLFFRDGVWHSFSHHSKFSFLEKDKALEEINNKIVSGSENLLNTDYLFITFGTAWVYELISTGQIVSNCHKVPSDNFKRFRLKEPEITEVFCELLEELWKINPGLKVIFTVSPIRHWKDGAVENQLSKSTLLLSLNNITEMYDDPICNYFPSYEIVMDELRDYRFYSEDMIHLSDVAINHIWQKFQKVFIEKESQRLFPSIQKIQKAVDHKPFNSETPEFKNFATKSLNKINSFILKHPYLDLNSEKEYFEKQLIKFKSE